MAQDFIVVTGAPVSGDYKKDGAVPIRREIRELKENDPKQWYLYIKALTEFKKVSEDKPLSYFQIAGIHGLPYTEYNPVEDIATDKYETGYCTHGSVLFPTWHRPYLALFEQQLSQHARDIAESIGDDQGRANYIQAAEALRMPYWDWALGVKSDHDLFPPIFYEEQVEVQTPTSSGKTVQVENPLRCYQSPSLQGLKDPEEDAKGFLSETVRAWNDKEANSADYSHPRINLVSGFRNLRETLVLILSSYKRYGPFSNNAAPDNDRSKNGETWGSLELVHDIVHGKVGESGHMGAIPYAAFEPVFWLHHCNIDRYFAIWQALNPTQNKIPPQTAGSGGTFTTKWDQVENGQTPLTPFWKDVVVRDGAKKPEYWTSDDVFSNNFGYAYPETQSWKFKDEVEFRNSVASELYELYGNSSLANIILRLSIGPGRTRQERFERRWVPEMVVPPAIGSVKAPIENGQRKLVNFEDPKNKDKIVGLAKGGKYQEWLFNIRVQKHALNAPFYVYVFIGERPSGNADIWNTSAAHVGTFASLGDSKETGCVKCARDQGQSLEITGQVPLTIALAERVLSGQLPDLSADSVPGFLVKELHWRVVMGDGTPVPTGSVAALRVHVTSMEVTVPSSPNELPTYAAETPPYPEITTNRNDQGRGEGTGITSVDQL